MDRVEKDGMINYSVRSLDLRNVKEQAADARRRLANERHTAVKTMGTPILRPLTATAAAALASSVANTMGGRPGTASSAVLASSVNNGFGSSALSASALQTTTGTSSSSSSASSAATATATATPSSLVNASTNQAIMEVAALHAKCNYLENALEQLCRSFTSSLSSSSSSSPSSPSSESPFEYYTVTFGPGPIGMILTTSTEGSIEVAELRDDKEGRPLLAKASGKIRLHDTLLAINNHVLNRHGPPTLEAVALEFKGAARPVNVLFQRKRV